MRILNIISSWVCFVVLFLGKDNQLFGGVTLMAKSKIIKDLANSTVDTMTALKRAKVLLSEIDNQEVNNWIN